VERRRKEEKKEGKNERKNRKRGKNSEAWFNTGKTFGREIRGSESGLEKSSRRLKVCVARCCQCCQCCQCCEFYQSCQSMRLKDGVLRSVIRSFSSVECSLADPEIG
jgi:hypothetical protein